MLRLVKKATSLKLIKKALPKQGQQRTTSLRAVASAPEKDPTLKWKRVNAFLGQWRDLASSRRITVADSFARQEHYNLFGIYPEQTVPNVLVKARVALKHQYEGFREQGQLSQLTEGFLKDYKAAMSLTEDYSQFTLGRAEMLRLLKDEEEDLSSPGDKIVRKRGGGFRTKDVPVQEFIAKILLSNLDTKYTDDQIVKMARDKFPDSPMALKVKRMRRKVNKGKFSHLGKLVQPIPEFREDGSAKPIRHQVRKAEDSVAKERADAKRERRMRRRHRA